MSYHPRPTSHIRGPSLANLQNGPSVPHPTLVARVNEKKAELTNLLQSRDLSGSLAKQMEELEAQLKVLSNGTEAVAVVLSNWNSVLRAIHMAGQGLADATREPSTGDDAVPAQRLPQTLVRIPTNKEV